MTDTASSPRPARLSTGVPGLDERLGGGLLPGTLTVIVGATGIGKTQLGVRFAAEGAAREGTRGVIFDLTSRGDSQSHADYAQRMCGWKLTPGDGRQHPDLSRVFAAAGERADYLRIFDYSGRRVTRNDLGWEAWQDWKAELAARLDATIAFFYGAFIRGARRVVLDGVEPVERASESIQFELIEYIYHQILRKDADWVARDLFRQAYLRNEPEVLARLYRPQDIGCVLLSTSHESMLEDLISRPLDEGDLLTNANTVIYLGKIRSGQKLGRALYVAKHRGSACADEILPYTIDEQGLRLAE